MDFSGTIIPVSTIDWYGRTVFVVFFNGCDFKCLYCSNNELIRMSNPLAFIKEKREKNRNRKNKFLFRWDDVPGNDNERFIEFLKQNFDIDWVETAQIEKIDSGRTIRVSTKNNHLSLKLNGKTSVTLTFDDGRTKKLILKEKKGKLKIYNKEIKIVSSTLDPFFKKGNIVDIKEIEKQILESKGFVSAVVFSGGEPTAHIKELEHLAKFTKENGLLVGIETNGYYPDRLASMIRKKLIDKIFLDIKAPLDDAQKYSLITGGIRDAAERARESLNLQGVDIEVRTTVFRSFANVSGIAESLVGHDFTYVIQQGIPEYAWDEKIRQEKAFTRDELLALARSVSFLKDVRIRTREKGEEKVPSPRI